MVAATLTLYGPDDGPRLRCDVGDTPRRLTDTDMGTLVSFASLLFTEDREWVKGIELHTVFASSELARKRVSRLKAELASGTPILLNNRRGAYRLTAGKDGMWMNVTIWPWIEETFGARFCSELRSAYDRYKFGE